MPTATDKIFSLDDVQTILSDFFTKNVSAQQGSGVTQYIGARYVPMFADPLDWDKTKTYEPLTIVLYQGNSYTSRQSVPSGIEITNGEFWAETGNYNAQIEQYRAEVQTFDARITANENAITTKADKNAIDPIYANITTDNAEDNTTAFNNFATTKNSIVFGYSGEYNFTDLIFGNQDFIDFNGSIINANSITINKKNLKANKVIIKNGFLNLTNGITINDTYNVSIEDCIINTTGNGITINNSESSDAFINNCLIENKISNSATGIITNGDDNKFSNLRIYGYKIGIDHKNKNNFLENVHFLITDGNLRVDENLIANDNVLKCTMNNCYCDSYGIYVRQTNNNPVQLLCNNLHIHSWIKNIGNAALFDCFGGCFGHISGYYNNSIYHNNDIIKYYPVSTENPSRPFLYNMLTLDFNYATRHEFWHNICDIKATHNNQSCAYVEPNTGWYKIALMLQPFNGSQYYLQISSQFGITNININSNTNIMTYDNNYSSFEIGANKIDDIYYEIFIRPIVGMSPVVSLLGSNTQIGYPFCNGPVFTQAGTTVDPSIIASKRA